MHTFVMVPIAIGSGVHEWCELLNLQQIVPIAIGKGFFERVNWGVGVRA